MSLVCTVRGREAAPDGAVPWCADPLRGAARVSIAAVLTVVAMQLVAPQVWERWPWAPFAVGLLAGLPHGALDHLVPWWSPGAEGWDRRRLARTGGLLLAYLALAVGTFTVARAWPVPALVALLFASVLHFGTGESAVSDLRARRRGPPGRWLGFGATAVIIPLIGWPDAVRPVLDVLAPGSSELLLDPAVRVGAGLVTAAAIGVTAVLCLRARRWSELGELALLVVLVVVVPPLAAFGVYFGAWHGLRHLARLVMLDPANAGDLRTGRLRRPWGRIATQAAVPTGAVLVVLSVLMLTPGLFPRVMAGAASAGLAVVLALTVPHMLVVGLLDRRQRPRALRPARGTDRQARVMAAPSSRASRLLRSAVSR